MDNEKNKIVDRLFESRLKDAVVAPPAGLWDNISAGLENERLRRKVIWWRWVAAATILLFLGFGSWTAIHFSSVNHRGERIAGGPVISLPYGETAPQPNNTYPGHAPAEAAIASAHTHGQMEQAVEMADMSAETRRKVRDAVSDIRKGRLNGASDLARVPIVLTAMKSRTPERFMQGMPLPGTSHREISRFEWTAMEKDERRPELLDEWKDEREIVAWEEDEPDRKKRKMRWAIGGSVSPDVAFGAQVPVGSAGARTAVPSLPDDPASASRTQAAPVATFSTGLRASLVVSDRVSVRSGMLYTRRNVSQSELATSFGKQESFANNFSVDYLEVPVSLKYNIVDGEHFDYYVSTGVSGNLMLGYEQELQTSGGKVAARKVSRQDQVLTPAQGNLLLSTGMQYRAFERLSINLEPGIRYGFLTSDYAFSRQDPISFNVMSGLNFHF